MKNIKKIIILIFSLLLFGFCLGIEVGDVIKFNFEPRANAYSAENTDDGLGDYIKDVGYAYTGQENGLTYGWVDANDHPTENSKQRFVWGFGDHLIVNGRGKYKRTGPGYLHNYRLHLDPNNSPDYFNKKHFTFTIMINGQRENYNKKWKIKLPNGRYKVKVGVGDPNFTTTNRDFGFMIISGDPIHYIFYVNDELLLDKFCSENNVFFEAEKEITIDDGELVIDAKDSNYATIGFLEIEVLEFSEPNLYLFPVPSGLGDIKPVEPGYSNSLTYSGNKLDVNSSYGNRYFVKKNLILDKADPLYIEPSWFTWDGEQAKLLGISVKRSPGSYMILATDWMKIECEDKRMIISVGNQNISMLNKGNTLTLLFYNRLGESVKNVDRQIICRNQRSPNQIVPFEENEMIMKEDSFMYYNISSNTIGEINPNEIQNLVNPYPKEQPYFIDVLAHQLEIIDKQDDMMESLGVYDSGTQFIEHFETFGLYQRWLEHFGIYVDKQSFVDAFTGSVSLKDIGLANEIIVKLNCSILNRMNYLGLTSETCNFNPISLAKYDQENEFYSIDEILTQTKQIINSSNQIYLGLVDLKSQFDSDSNSLYIKTLFNLVLDYEYSNFMGYGISTRVTNLELLSESLNFTNRIDSEKTNLRGLYNATFELNQTFKGLNKLSRIYSMKDRWSTKGSVTNIVSENLIEDLLEFNDFHGNEVVNDLSIVVGDLQLYKLFSHDIDYFRSISRKLGNLMTEYSFTYHTFVSSVVATMRQAYPDINLKFDYSNIVSALNY